MLWKTNEMNLEGNRTCLFYKATQIMATESTPTARLQCDSVRSFSSYSNLNSVVPQPTCPNMEGKFEIPLFYLTLLSYSGRRKHSPGRTISDLNQDGGRRAPDDYHAICRPHGTFERIRYS